jgi:hypothetical protein
MVKAIAVVSDRYLVISYGISTLTHAIVIDIIQKRYGKLKLNHAVCFEYKITNDPYTDSPKRSIGFLQSSGVIKVVDFTIGAANSNGVALFGKYQYARSRTIQLEEVELETVQTDSLATVTDLLSLDGKVISSKVPPTGTIVNDTYRQYMFRCVGTNHSILVQGKFYLTSLLLKFNIHGRR